MPRTKTDTLSQTQQLILTAAARHPEQRVLCPETIKPPTFRASLQTLRKRGWVAAGRAGGCKRGSATEVITAEGLAAIGFTPSATAETSTGGDAARPAAGQHKATKQTLLLSLLGQDEGATLEALSAATHWLPHTTRAALTRLRQRGLAIVTERVAGQSTRYRIAARDGAPSAGEAA